MRILGITAFIHNSSAALLDGGKIVAAADEERFTREKFTGAFPRNAVSYCLRAGNLEPGDVDWIAFYWNPWLGIPQRLWTMARSMPHSLAFFKKAAPGHEAVRGDFGSWLSMAAVGRVARLAVPGLRARVWHAEHHLAHAASAYYCSGWDDAMILSLDGTGEWTTTLCARGQGGRIRKLREVTYPHSLGALYGAITQYLGYRIYEDEWKVMGLAALGVPRYADAVRSLIRADGQGGFRLDLAGFNFQHADKGLWYGRRFIEMFGPPRGRGEPAEQERFADLAASFQLVTEEIALGLVRWLYEQGGGCPRLCLAGGVALNAVLNGKITARTGFGKVFVQPAAADNGAALGAALLLHHRLTGAHSREPLRDVCLGPEYSNEEIRAVLDASGVRSAHCPDIEARVAALLAGGAVVGWFQGRMEYGPRALGNRSILADPRHAAMKHTLNGKVKFREAFRPFAPAILAERVSDYFEVDPGSRFPFMTEVHPIRADKRAVIPAATHFDGSGRLQTVGEDVAPRFHRLIAAFERLTGVPAVINTSFNLAGEPIVCSPHDAISTYLRSGLDALAIGDYLCVKSPGA